MSSERFLSVISAILFIVGAALLAFAIWLASDSIKFLYGSLHAEGVVVELVEKAGKDRDNNHMMLWYPVVEFTAQPDQTIHFESRLGSSPSMYSKGQSVDVVYQPFNPQDARINSTMDMWYMPGFLGSAALLMILVSMGLVFSILSRRRERKRLMSIGHVITTEVYGVMPDISMSIRGRHPYRILSRYHHMESGKTYVFESDPIWYNPEDFFSETKDLSVYVDPQDYSRYYIDLSFLPKTKIEVEM